MIVARDGGTFPRELEAIAALPGVGRSTAAAIAALAFDQRAAILDGNVKRVIARHRGVEGFPGAPKVEARLWRIAETLLPARAVATYTQALMDLGATLCTRARPRCGECPVASDCIALRDGRVDELPTPRATKVLPQRAVRVLLIERAGEILLEKRPAIGIWGGLWSLPELDVEADVAAHCRARFRARVVAGDELAPDRARLHAFPAYAAAAARRGPGVADARRAAGLSLAAARRRAGGRTAGADPQALATPLTSDVTGPGYYFPGGAPVAQIRGQPLLVIGVRDTEGRELLRRFVDLPFIAQPANHAQSIPPPEAAPSLARTSPLRVSSATRRRAFGAAQPALRGLRSRRIPRQR